MIHQLQNLLFVFNVIHMLALDDILLFHSFEGELFAFVLFQMGQLDVTESA